MRSATFTRNSADQATLELTIGSDGRANAHYTGDDTAMRDAASRINREENTWNEALDILAEFEIAQKD